MTIDDLIVEAGVSSRPINQFLAEVEKILIEHNLI